MPEHTHKIIFVLGGAKSGKSSFALDQAGKCQGRRLYIATAQALDAEMHGRIERHKQERGSDWDTIEEPLRLADIIRTVSNSHDVVLIDCLTLWVSNLLCNNVDAEKEFEAFIDSVRDANDSSVLVIVSNEVGQGIVPDNALSRQFRDLAGLLNQKVALVADEVYLVTAGIPLKIKP